jgi:copper chaperone CopZ
MQTIDIPIRGMTCASCVATIERGLRRVPGVQTATVDLAAAHASVTYDPTVAQVNDLIQAIAAAGYEVTAARAAGNMAGMAHQPSIWQTVKPMLKMGACCAGPILGLALLAPLAGSLGMGFSSVLSFLLILACPLSMLVMLYVMGRGHAGMRGQGRAEERPLPMATSADSAVAMAVGNGQPEGRDTLPVLEEAPPTPVLERAPVKRQRSRR